MILKLSKTKRLSFYRKTDIYIGEKNFDEIQVLIPSEVDENDTSELTFKLHLVNERGEYAIRTLTVEQEGTKVVGSTSITADLTSVAQDFSVYIEMVKSNDTIIGKTNVLEVRVNPLPDEQGEIIPEEIEKRGVIIAQTNPPDSSHKKYRLGALWINYADETQYVLTDIDESQAPQEYGYVWNKVSNQTVISSDSAPEYTPNNVDYKYSVGDVWVQTDSNAEKIVAISVCTGNTKVTIDAQNWKYNYTWAVLTSGSNDYTDLENKPSINNVTLSGNKSSDDLGLQGKLTAGQNITIDEDNVISAEGGGVTSYNDLTDKPTVRAGNSQIVPLSGTLMFTSGFSLGNYLPGELIRVDLSDISRRKLENWQNYFYGVSLEDFDLYVHPRYNFNDLSDPLVGTDFTNIGYIRTKGECLTNTPQIFSSNISNNSRVLIIHYNAIPRAERYHYLLRVIYFQDSSTNKIRQFAQWIYYESEQDTTVHNVTDWCEIGGGSQIVSGVVNANGTITFTDSDGNTFTTSGSSVIGPQGDDYVLTAQDKEDIADIVLSELPTTQEVLYGNTSN